jgi:hypothetical protein
MIDKHCALADAMPMRQRERFDGQSGLSNAANDFGCACSPWTLRRNAWHPAADSRTMRALSNPESSGSW